MKRTLGSTIGKFIPNKAIAQFYFFIKFNKFFSTTNPITWNEKIQRRKFKELNASHAVWSDKFMARYLAQTVSTIKVPDLYASFKSVDEIEFSQLPETFVIKTNHDSGSVFIVKDKSKINESEIRNKLSKSMLFDYGKLTGQKHYSWIERRIVVEELLLAEDGEIPVDIKVHCFHGEPKLIQIAGNTHETNDLYDTDWKVIDVSYSNKQTVEKHPKPDNFDDVLKHARELSKEFDYVRVDMYSTKNGLVFGEMTFTAGNGFAKFDPIEFDIELGRYW